MGERPRVDGSWAGPAGARGASGPARRRGATLAAAAWVVTAWVVTAWVGAAVAGPAGATEPVPSGALGEALQRSVLPPWRVAEVVLYPPEAGPVDPTAPPPADASVEPDGAAGAPGPLDPGTAAATGDAFRFVATVELTEPTYRIADQIGPYTFLDPVAEPGMRKTLTGTAATSPESAPLPSRFAFANPDVLAGIGRPISMIGGAPVIDGTDEARDLRRRLDEAAAAAARAGTERQARARARAEARATTAAAEAARLLAENDLVDHRREVFAGLARLFASDDRAERLAAVQAGMASEDAAIRALAFDAAYASTDPVLARLALDAWLGAQTAVPVELFATRDDPDSRLVLTNLGPLTLTVESYDPVRGVVTGTLGAPGYGITQASPATGKLAQTQLTVNGYGCQLALRLTRHRTLDGTYRCQSLPVLVARITLD